LSRRRITTQQDDRRHGDRDREQRDCLAFERRTRHCDRLHDTTQHRDRLHDTAQHCDRPLGADSTATDCTTRQARRSSTPTVAVECRNLYRGRNFGGV
jgi:hypothetical protein